MPVGELDRRHIKEAYAARFTPDRQGRSKMAEIAEAATSGSIRTLGDVLIPLVLDRYGSIGDVNEVDRMIGTVFTDSILSIYEQGNLSARGGYSARGVREHLSTYGGRMPPSVAGELSGVIIGKGPGGIFAGKLLEDLGIGKLRYVEPKETGGIWAPSGPWGQEKYFGYNNPGSIQFQNAYLSLSNTRRTHEMQQFLEESASRRMDSQTTHGTVTGVDINSGQHIVHYADEKGHDKELPPADFVIVGTGNQPLPLHGGYITVESPHEETIERWPHLMSDDEALKMNANGQRIICIGWGNSTMAKIREVDRLNWRLGTDLQVVVLSHFTEEMLSFPHTPMPQSDGRMRSVARNPGEGEYTKLELDIEESWRLYLRNLFPFTDFAGNVVSGTIPDVKHCQIIEEGDVTNALVTVLDRDRYGRVNGTKTVLVPDVGQVNALIGYGNDADLMRRCGFELLDDYRGIVNTRPYDNRAITPGNEINVFAVGAAGYRRDNPSARVIPGILKTAAEVGITATLQAWDKHLQRLKGAA